MTAKRPPDPDETAATQTTKCPFCKARPRQGCTTSSRDYGWRATRRPHKQRMVAWREAQLLAEPREAGH